MIASTKKGTATVGVRFCAVKGVVAEGAFFCHFPVAWGCFSMFKGSVSSVDFHIFLLSRRSFVWDDCSIAKDAMNGRIERKKKAES